MLIPRRLVLVSALLLLTGTVTGAPDFAEFSHDEALAYSQRVIGQSLSDNTLTRSDGSQVTLSEYVGKPLVISLIYTSCHHICPTTTSNLEKVIDKARSALGEDSFQVVTVGFDAENDTPLRMAQLRERLGIDDNNWEFLSADAASIKPLTESLGFIYYPSPKGFEHLIQASVIDGSGTIYRQVYGISFPTPILIEPLKELVFGQPTNLSLVNYLENRIRLFCTVYDPATDRYEIDISVFIGTFVGIIVSFLFGYVLIREWRKSLRS